MFVTYSESRQKIENLLAVVKKDLVTLQMKRPNVNPRVHDLINEINDYLNQLAGEPSKIFAEGEVANERAHQFYNLLLELYLEGFDTLGLQDVIETKEEAKIVVDFKEKFMDLMDEISKFM